MENVAQHATPESVWAALQESNRILTEKFAEIAARQVATERFIDKVSKQIEKTDRQIAKTEKMVGGISNSHGSFAEEYFFNSFNKGKKNFFGERFDKILRFELVTDTNKKTRAEYDFLLVNGTSVAIIEVKFKVREKAVEHVLGKIKHFRQNFPEYKNHRVYLGIASLVFDDQVETECEKNGIAIIKQEGNSVVINDKNLKAFE